MKPTDIIAKDWDEGSDAYYDRIYGEGRLQRLTADPAWAFPPEVRAMLSQALPDLRGKRVLVPSSGDNGAAFAFHLLGAKVTSTDISKRQLRNAQRIAEAQGWDIEFVLADSMRLCGIPDQTYDLVYTSNGVHVWINDLAALYGSIARTLKPGGRYILFETHPFVRPFDGEAGDRGEFVVQKLYEETGPFGAVPTYAWRIMDLVNALRAAGFALERMEEFHPRIGAFDSWWYGTPSQAEADGNAKFDWKKNPWAALPQWVGFSMRKEVASS